MEQLLHFIPREAQMNAILTKFLFAAAAVAIAAGASITRADEQPVIYGRAGYPVAEQRIQQLSQMSGQLGTSIERDVCDGPWQPIQRSFSNG